MKEASASSSSAIDLSAGIHLLLEMKPGAQAGAAESLAAGCLLSYTACPTSCAWLLGGLLLGGLLFLLQRK